jgi:hypothetical protein
MTTAEDEEGHSMPEVVVNIYPGVLSNYIPLKQTHHIPARIRLVYEQTILALKAGSKLLAGAGFRALIEAVCLEEKIKGGNLEQKINNLTKNRLISEKESERLHSIRFLGNDSIHEMEVPSNRKLYLVLKIVEHLLENLYIIDRDASGVLDTIITDYEDFIRLVKKCVYSLPIGEERTLQQILGKHQRRISAENLAKLESALVKQVELGEFKPLEVIPSDDNKVPLAAKFKVVSRPSLSFFDFEEFVDVDDEGPF